MMIGIDIGGTHTDAVLVGKGEKILSAVKVPTTAALEVGVENALARLLTASDIAPDAIEGVFVGTTAAVNAVLEEKELLRVGLLRLAGQKPALRAGSHFPPSLREKVLSSVQTIGGGHECFGQALSPLDRREARLAISELLEDGAEAIAIVGVFAPLYSDHEHEAAQIVLDVAGKDFPLSCSGDIGGLGFIERENATILNVSLKKVIATGFCKLHEAVQKQGLQCPVYMVRNDGSQMDFREAFRFPILTLASGQTNSFRGAARLSGLDDLVVIDVGGTSSDIGIVRNGTPVRSIHAAKIGGVKILSALPDVASLAYGGGTIIRGDTIGPQSAGRDLCRLAQCFGGDLLTLTDIGVRLGYFEGDLFRGERVQISEAEARKHLQKVHEEILSALRLIRGKEEKLPCAVVGGGAPLLGKLDFLQPDFYGYANAYGAALSEISAAIDTIRSLEKREEVLEELKAEAIARAVAKGADPGTVRITNLSIIPYGYSSCLQARVLITASGKRRRAHK